MKKSIVLSSVAAIAVAGMLVLSGCGGNSGTSTKTKKGSTQEVQDKISIVVGKDGKVSSATPAKTIIKNGKAGLSETKVSVKTVKCEGEENDSCESKCTTTNPCEVIAETSCGQPDGILTNYAEADKVQTAFADLASYTGDKISTGKEADFSGMTIIDSSDVTGASFDYSTFIKCALDQDGDTHYVAANEDGSPVYALVAVKYSDGTIEWKEVEIQFIDQESTGLSGQPFISLSDLNTNGSLPVTLEIFSIIDESTPAQTTGATGSTGSTGGSGS